MTTEKNQEHVSVTEAELSVEAPGPVPYVPTPEALAEANRVLGIRGKKRKLSEKFIERMTQGHEPLPRVLAGS